MTIGTERRNSAQDALRRWAERQILHQREPDAYVCAENGEDLAAWMGGDYRHNGHPIYVTENGLLIVWDTWTEIGYERGLIVVQTFFRQRQDWVTCIHQDDLNDPWGQYPDLEYAIMDTADLVGIADYLATL